MRPFKLSVGINDHSILSVIPLVRPFVVEMGKSNPKWSEPQTVIEGEQDARSPAAKKRPTLDSSSQALKKKKKVVDPFCAPSIL